VDFCPFEKYGDDRWHISDLIVLHLCWTKRWLAILGGVYFR